jgi:hypothetical protein
MEPAVVLERLSLYYVAIGVSSIYNMAVARIIVCIAWVAC